MITPDEPWCSGPVLPESESPDMMLDDDLWCSDPILLESVMPADHRWCIRRMVPPESGSSMKLPEPRGMDPYDAEEETTNWGSAKPEEEPSIRSMLKSVDETEKKNPMPDESKAAAEDGGKKRRKKVMVTVSKEHIEYMMEHPLPSPYKPPSDPLFCPLFREALDMLAAKQEAAFKEQERIIEDFLAMGYAQKEYEVADDDEEV
jgi:hypothetical protein